MLPVPGPVREGDVSLTSAVQPPSVCGGPCLVGVIPTAGATKAVQMEGRGQAQHPGAGRVQPHSRARGSRGRSGTRCAEPRAACAALLRDAGVGGEGPAG